MANKIKYGLSEVHVAFATDSGWDTPVAIPGAVNLSVEPQGSDNPFYADNDIYFNQKASTGYSGTLEMALLPDSVKAQMFGDYVDSSGKYVENAQGVPKSFALMFQVEGDESARRTVYYDVTASRSNDENSTTEDTITPGTETIDVTIKNHEFTIGTGSSAVKIKVPRTVCHAEDSEYATFFSAVVPPASAPSA